MGDLAGRDFWNGFWATPGGRSFGRYGYYYWYFSRLLATCVKPGQSAVELGCGASVWVPLLAERGIDSWGVDYSDVGVRLVQAQLAQHGVSATVVHGDVFDTTTLPSARFDLVYSLGLLEHFDDPSRFTARCLELCKPGGLTLTLVPNFDGFWGTVQKKLDPEMFAVHQLYTPERLDAVHTSVGFEPHRPARYMGGISPLVVNPGRALSRLPAVATKGVIGGVWLSQQAICWATALLPDRIHNPPSLAAHVVGVYRRPA